MPTEIFSNSRVVVVEDEGMGGLVVLRITIRKIGVGVSVLVDQSGATVLASGDSKMEIVSHGGSPAVRVSK